MPKERVTDDHKTTRTPKKTKAGDKHQGERGGDSTGLVNLQRQVGNQAVQRLVAQRRGDDATTLNDDTAARVEREKGGGEPLDAEVAREMGQALGDDFSDVRVHTDSEADELNRTVSARAFTTGRDLFFREGEYDPHSAEGKELLAHELTHVVQQSHGQVASSGGGTTVNAPHDVHEQEAERVSKDISGGGAQLKRQLMGGDGLQRAASQEEEEPLQMAETPEEEEPLQTAATQEEEEPLQMAATQEEEEPLQMAEAPEEEEPLQTAATQEEEEPLQMAATQEEEEPLQMAEAPEEEEPLQAKRDHRK